MIARLFLKNIANTGSPTHDRERGGKKFSNLNLQSRKAV